MPRTTKGTASIPSIERSLGSVARTPAGRVALDEMLTIEQSAERLNMSVRYVRRLIAERRIAFHKIGRSVRLKATDIAAFVDAGRVEPITAASIWRDLGRAA